LSAIVKFALRPRFKEPADDLSRICPASERETLRNDGQRCALKVARQKAFPRIAAGQRIERSRPYKAEGLGSTPRAPTKAQVTGRILSRRESVSGLSRICPEQVKQQGPLPTTISRLDSGESEVTESQFNERSRRCRD
jgi:hypothetical protein